MLRAEFVGRSLLEGVDESHQAGTVRESFTKEMNVVRHNAMGVEQKALLSGVFQELI